MSSRFSCNSEANASELQKNVSVMPVAVSTIHSHNSV